MASRMVDIRQHILDTHHQVSLTSTLFALSVVMYLNRLCLSICVLLTLS